MKLKRNEKEYERFDFQSFFCVCGCPKVNMSDVYIFGRSNPYDFLENHPDFKIMYDKDFGFVAYREVKK